MIYRDDHPLVVFGRLLTCTCCGSHVDLIEIPAPLIDADTYVCGECLAPVTSGFLPSNEGLKSEVHIVETARDRILNGTYDPRTEPVPF